VRVPLLTLPLVEAFFLRLCLLLLLPMCVSLCYKQILFLDDMGISPLNYRTTICSLPIRPPLKGQQHEKCSPRQ
jgi:hypothetical protein